MAKKDKDKNKDDKDKEEEEKEPIDKEKDVEITPQEKSILAGHLMRRDRALRETGKHVDENSEYIVDLAINYDFIHMPVHVEHKKLLPKPDIREECKDYADITEDEYKHVMGNRRIGQGLNKAVNDAMRAILGYVDELYKAHDVQIYPFCILNSKFTLLDEKTEKQRPRNWPEDLPFIILGKK